jgi:rfaE bifunctional protein kinase chain/domain
MSLQFQKILQEIKKRNSPDFRIVFVSGNFNILHPGHLRLLRFAKECGNILVVGVYGDELKKGAIVKDFHRLEGLKSISYVDYSFILDEEPENFIRKFKPNIVIKGKEHEVNFNPEKEVVESYGGKLLFSSGDISFSSIDLLKSELHNINYLTIKKPLDFTQRHNFTIKDLTHVVNEFKKLKVIVIGESIIDEYITCDPLGMSQEDPTIVVSPLYTTKFIGGAAIVAAHAKALGADVDFLTITGNDKNSGYLHDELEKQQVKNKIYLDDSRPTTLKQRFRANNKTLLRVNKFKQHPISKDIQSEILKDFEKVIEYKNLVVFSDFNYGMLPTDFAEKLIKICKTKDLIIAADSQSSSQIGDVSRFKDVDLLTPTEREARIATEDYNSGLVVLAEKLRNNAGADNILLKLNSEGLLIHAGLSNNEFLTDKLPAMNHIPKDPAGAGDSLLIIAAMTYALTKNIWKTAYLGSIAAAVQISKLGNNPITIDELISELK